MLLDPLHPAIVHFPIVFAFLLPLFAAGALWAIRRGARPTRAWALPLAMAAALTASAWAAQLAGEAEEDRVEDVVGETALHEHEENGERFVLLSTGLLLVVGAGLLGGTVGSAARILGTLGSLGVLVAGFMAAETGGELVYRHGAAEPYVSAARGDATGPASTEDADRDD